MYRILGPLELVVGRKTVRIGRNRQAVILALLLLNANKTVPVDRLVEAVWCGDPPKTAHEQILTCVWRLRTLLTREGYTDCPIETRPLGYVLHVKEDQLDAWLFESLVREARAAREAGDSARAIEGFRKALALFNGPVLNEIPNVAVQVTAAQWEEQRLAVFEECVDLELATGVDQHLIGELTAMVRENPLCEQMRGQLMVALDRKGRRADALAVYRSGRQTLVTQLGLEPGPKLQELHRQVLMGTVQITEEPHTSVPRQLPPDIADFTGREDQVEKLVSFLTSGSDKSASAPQTAVVMGRAGVGKTALALHAAHKAADRFADGQLYAHLGGSSGAPVDPAVLVRRFLRGLGVAEKRVPDSAKEQIAMYRSILAERSLLIVLDDVSDTEQVWPLLAGSGSTVVLATTSTRRVELAGAQHVELDALGQQEAIAMLSRIVGDSRVTAEPTAVRPLVEAIGRLPLAVRAAGSRLTSRPHLGLDYVAKRLQDDERCLDELVCSSFDVPSRLDSSLLTLTDEERHLWLALNLLGLTDFASWAAAAVLDRSVSTAEKMMDSLVDRRLLDVLGEDVTGTARYRIDRLAGIHARKRALSELSPAVREVALERAAHTWLTLAGQAFRMLGCRPGMMDQRLGDCKLEADVVTAVRDVPDVWLKTERAALDQILELGRHLFPGLRRQELIRYIDGLVAEGR
ncbi:BTAD domain-containing putative transcriptional regulator [Actinopolyspora saharensis]|uniref:AfsR/SARP family transcriptional regulator n=1 Tax=Actinopolyspora saharensis TaxID=995062 RepID=UPI003F67A544